MATAEDEYNTTSALHNVYYAKQLKQIFNVAPCLLPHLLYNPTHALFTLQNTITSTFKTNKMLKNVFVSIKPLHVSVFFHDRLQGVLCCALCHYYSRSQQVSGLRPLTC